MSANELFLSRQKYDALLAAEAAWMMTDWPKMKRSWTLDGVHLSGTAKQIDTLRSKVTAATLRSVALLAIEIFGAEADAPSMGYDPSRSGPTPAELEVATLAADNKLRYDDVMSEVNRIANGE